MSDHCWDDEDETTPDADPATPNSRLDAPLLLESQLADPRRVDRRKLLIAAGLVGAVLLGAGGVYASKQRGVAPVGVARREAPKSSQAPDHFRDIGKFESKPAPTEPCEGVVEDGVCYPPDDKLDKAVLTATAQPTPADDGDPCPGCTPAQAIALEEARMKAAGDPEGRGAQYMGRGKPTYATNPRTGKAELVRGTEDEGDYTRLELAPISMHPPNHRPPTAIVPSEAPDALQMPMMPMAQNSGGVQVPAGLKEALEAAQNGGGGDPDRVKEDFAAKALALDSGNVPRELGECELTAGDVIHVSNLTAINTDVPARATITAMVTETVYCGTSRQYVAIPAGARFTASANSRVAYGDHKIQVCMDQLRLPPSSSAPNGSVIATDCWAAADIGGMVGWDGEVDNHWPQLLAGVALSTLFSLGTASAAGNQEGWAPTLGQRAASQAGGQLNTAGQRVTQRELQRKPTIVRRSLQAGAVIVTRNQPLTPHVGIAMQIKRPLRRRR